MNTGQQRRILRVVIAVLAAGVVAHGLHSATGIGSDSLFADWVYNLLMWGGVALCAARALAMRAERGAWAFLAASLAVWAAADLTWTLHFNHVEDPPYPNVADVLYLASYPLTYVGLVMLLRARLRPLRASLWLDGAVSGLTLAALVTALLFGPILHATEGKPLAVAVTLAYPAGDLLLLCCVGVALGITGWRPGRAWAVLALSLVLTAIGDAIYSYIENTGAYTDGSLVDTFWPASVLAMGVAAWQPRRRGEVSSHGVAVLIPAAFAVLALGLLLYGWVAELPTLAGVLAAGGLLAAMARGGLTFRENLLLLRRSHQEALTDGLSGLANRREAHARPRGRPDRRRPARARCCSSTSTASRRTTTRSGIPRATRCSPGSAARWAARSRAAAPPTGSAATSSASFSTAGSGDWTRSSQAR